MTDEAELLQRLRNREKNSIDEAIQIYTPYLSTVLYHMAGNSLPKEDIEEIVADVFVILWKNAERIDLQKGMMTNSPLRKSSIASSIVFSLISSIMILIVLESPVNLYKRSPV